MGTHDSRVAVDAITDAHLGHPAADVTAQSAPNVRVAPSPAPRAAWDCDVPPDDDPTGASGAPDADARDMAAHDTAMHDTAGHDVGGPDARDGARRPGRPRSERAEQAIIDATIEAIGECGIDGVRCEDVAARAGVGKATLYRRWPGKEDLLIAAFAAMRRPLPQPRGESAREDLIRLLTVVAEDADDPRYAQQYALLHGAGERFPRLVTRYKERVMEPRRELVRSVLRRGIEAGELRADTDVEVAMLLLTGAVMARGKHDSSAAAPGFVDRAVDELLRGISAR
jgi:AcrR family transcriptional regulator